MMQLVRNVSVSLENRIHFDAYTKTKSDLKDCQGFPRTRKDLSSTGYVLANATLQMDRRCGTLAKNYCKSLASPAKILPRSCQGYHIMQDRAKRTMFYHDLGKDTIHMQDRAKANHDLGKDAKINHILDKGSMVANSVFW